MKTAVSIPDRIFEDAERLADERGVSRSELYARAVAEYVDKQRSVGVTERLNAVYDAHPEDAELDAELQQWLARTLFRERW